ncbi:unnamed protein product [Chilo suppressalis]|uniref:Uncharacterized protein n=1 Tax=Chilo suppressalis TaxID=168631 RepID=A0ABN8B645_CHISP|nr:unnamed protein product [Chilo suppressalis]
MSESGGAGGSTPNLFTCCDEEERMNSRKRKDRSHVHDLKQDLLDFRAEMMNFFREFGKTQNENLTKIRQEISEMREEIKTIKSVSENLTHKANKITSEVQEIKSEYAKTKEKVNVLEKDLFHIKNRQNSEQHFPDSLISNHESLLSELKDHNEREKNIIMVGIPEKNDKNYSARREYDDEMVMKTLELLHANCSKPNKCIRLGKYNSSKDRALKLCFDNTEIPKQLLRNKSKLSDNIKLYSERTPSQKTYLQSIREELKRREENGENKLIIKYVKGIPKILQNNLPKN